MTNWQDQSKNDRTVWVVFWLSEDCQIGMKPLVARKRMSWICLFSTHLRSSTPGSTCRRFCLSFPVNSVHVFVRRQTAIEHLIPVFRFLGIQFRCGKRQDTISDKRGIHNTRLTRHNRCGKINSKCPVERLVETSRRFDVQRHFQLVRSGIDRSITSY